MLNLSYDVSVKLYSIRLLVMAGLIALPDARRLLAAALGRATAEVPTRVRMSPRRERLRQIAKAVLLVGIAVGLCLELGLRQRDAHRHELYGTWVVDTFAADGVEHPPLTTDPVRWHSLTAHPAVVRIRLMPGEPDPPDPVRDYYVWKVDETRHTVTLTIDAGRQLAETWRYSRPAPDRLVIDGVHLGKSLHVALHAAPPPRLLTRGFHWISDAPFNP
jgi:hypothetical protein